MKSLLRRLRRHAESLATCEDFTPQEVVALQLADRALRRVHEAQAART